MEEEWKEVKGYEGIYEVSNLGNVRSKNRNIYSENQSSSYTYKVEGNPISPFDNGTGYLQVNLSKKSKARKKYVHRIVYESFVSKIPENREINHIDHNKNNNRLSNLEVVSRKENQEKMSMFYLHKKRKENPELFECKICKGPKTPEKEVELCRTCYMKKNGGKILRPMYYELKKMVEKYGVSKTSRILHVSHTTIRNWLNKYKPKQE